MRTHHDTCVGLQYVFMLGGWDGLKCNSDVAVYSPDGAPSAHMAPGTAVFVVSPCPRWFLASASTESSYANKQIRLVALYNFPRL